MNRRTLFTSAPAFAAGAAALTTLPAELPAAPPLQQPSLERLRQQEQAAFRKLIAPVAATAGNCAWTADEQKDRARCLAAGLTDDEATTWLLIARMGAKFLALPELASDDIPELTTTIHQLQVKLMWRATYRRYQAAAAAAPPPRE